MMQSFPLSLADEVLGGEVEEQIQFFLTTMRAVTICLTVFPPPFLVLIFAFAFIFLHTCNVAK